MLPLCLSFGTEYESEQSCVWEHSSHCGHLSHRGNRVQTRLLFAQRGHGARTAHAQRAVRPLSMEFTPWAAPSAPSCRAVIRQQRFGCGGGFKAGLPWGLSGAL